MPHPKGPESLQDLLGKIADNVQLTNRLIRRLPKSLASHVLSAQGAAIGPAPVVAPPQQRDDAAIDKTTPSVVPEGHYARCVRCSYTWNPRVRYPKTCPTRPDPRAADGTCPRYPGPGIRQSGLAEAAARLHQLSPTERLCGGGNQLGGRPQ